ncbi:MAG TPA: inositol monophosphatase family protein [Planctomycetota bacterium]|nr:inositol monophosphatase family protein [Planctomycetota bacterium]
MSEASDDEAALAVARGAALEAGAELLARYEKLDRRTVRTKSIRRDLVSEADLASEKVILARIRAAFRDDAIRAEESSRAAVAGSAVWHVDPLDGTTNFVHGLPEFSISIARYRDGAPRVAVVHAPKLGETYTALAGGGAHRNGERLHVTKTAELADALLATGFPYRRGELPNDNVANFAHILPLVRDLRRLGSAALDLAFVAAGRFDAYWELHLEPHDVAAGALLVREAGGRVTDVAGGDAWLEGRSVVASNGPLHEPLRSRLSG